MTKKTINVSIIHFYLLSSLLLPLFCFSEPTASTRTYLVWKAEQLQDAGQVSDAQDIYENLLKSNLEPWEAAIIRYNFGTLLVHQNAWSEALQQYYAITNKAQLSPVVKQNLLINTAIALASQGSRQSQKEAQQLLHEAERASCQLEQMEGYKHCFLTEKMQQIRGILENQIALSLKKETLENLLRIPIAIRVKQLLQNLHTETSQLSVLLHDGKSDLKNAYLVYQQDQALWDSLQFSLQGQVKTLLLQAKSFRKISLDYLSNEKIQDALLALNAAEKHLYQLLALLPKSPIWYESLQKNLIDLQEILAEFPLSKKRLTALQTQLVAIPTQLSLDETLNETVKTTIRNSLKNGLRLYQSALTNLQNKNNTLARIYLLGSQMELQNASQLSQETKETFPRTLLQEMIIDQEYALSLTRLAQQAEAKGEIYSILEQSQKLTQSKSSLFPQSVLTQQQRQFSKEERCQEKPWTEVMPLYEQGRKTGEETIRLLQLETILFDEVLLSQEASLNYWKRALSLIEKEDSSSREEQNNSLKSSEDTAADQILKNVLKMQVTDQLKNQEKGSTKKVERPW